MHEHITRGLYYFEFTFCLRRAWDWLIAVDGDIGADTSQLERVRFVMKDGLVVSNDGAPH
jgi:hypothetical protein